MGNTGLLCPPHNTSASDSLHDIQIDLVPIFTFSRVCRDLLRTFATATQNLNMYVCMYYVNMILEQQMDTL